MSGAELWAAPALPSGCPCPVHGSIQSGYQAILAWSALAWHSSETSASSSSRLPSVPLRTWEIPIFFLSLQPQLYLLPFLLAPEEEVSEVLNEGMQRAGSLCCRYGRPIGCLQDHCALAYVMLRQDFRKASAEACPGVYLAWHMKQGQKVLETRVQFDFARR